MRKKYAFWSITCLVAAFAVCLLLSPCFAVSVSPTPDEAVDVNPADLEGDFNQLAIGMSTEQVTKLLGHPVTIQAWQTDGRQWKYFLPGGTARLYLNFKDDKIVEIKKLEP